MAFTHKDVNLFHGAPAQVRSALDLLRSNYLIGVHWGHVANDVPELSWVDFHLAGAGTLYLQSGVTTPHIKLCSRNFLPAEFKVLGGPKLWDVINVSRPLQLKNLNEFMASIRLLYDRGVTPRVLMVCPAPSSMDAGDGWHASIEEDYERYFSREERERVTLLLLRANYPFPLSTHEIAFLLNASRCFALFSDYEGESRAVAEALLCGVPVVAKSGVRGGAGDYLDGSNSRRFGTEAEAAAAIEDFMSMDAAPFDALAIRAELSEEASVPRLRAELQKLFAIRQVPYEGEERFDNLSRRLPAHVLTLPQHLRRDLTDDLRSDAAALEFIDGLLGRLTPENELKAVRRAGAAKRRLATMNAALRAGRARVGQQARRLGLRR